MASPEVQPPLLSYDLQALIGFAIVDASFQQLLLRDPRQALAAVKFKLSARERKALLDVRGAQSLAEYALRLEQRLAEVDTNGGLLVRHEADEPPERQRAAS